MVFGCFSASPASKKKFRPTHNSYHITHVMEIMESMAKSICRFQCKIVFSSCFIHFFLQKEENSKWPGMDFRWTSTTHNVTCNSFWNDDAQFFLPNLCVIRVFGYAYAHFSAFVDYIFGSYAKNTWPKQKHWPNRHINLMWEKSKTKTLNMNRTLTKTHVCSCTNLLACTMITK